LEVAHFQDIDARKNTKDYLDVQSSPGAVLLIEFLMEEIELVVVMNYRVQNRAKSK